MIKYSDHGDYLQQRLLKEKKMKFDDLKFGDKFLLRYCGKDVAYASLHEFEVVQISKESKAILFIIRYGIGASERYEWKSIDDLNKAYEIFDFVK